MDSGRFKLVRMAEDIISRLPDDVLIKIISCLEVKDAVKTSILSSISRHHCITFVLKCIHQVLDLRNIMEFVLQILIF